MDGVEEEAAGFDRPIDLATASRFRRIGGVGPVYEVLAINDHRVRSRMVDSDEEFTYPLADAQADPLA